MNLYHIELCKANIIKSNIQPNNHQLRNYNNDHTDKGKVKPHNGKEHKKSGKPQNNV